MILRTTKALIDDPEMSRDNARWFRFSQRGIDRCRDGLTLDANVPSMIENFFAKLFPPSRSTADPSWLKTTKDTQLATAPMLGIIAVRAPYDRPTAILVGRLWPRLHLLLVSQGLAAQPLNQPIEHMNWERQLGQPFNTPEALRTFVPSATMVPTFVFRARYPNHSAAASPRRPLMEVMVQT